MKLHDRIYRWAKAQQIGTEQIKSDTVATFEQGHLTHPHGHYLITATYIPCGTQEEIVRLQLTCTANDVSDELLRAHEQDTFTSPVVAIATTRTLPLTEQLWKIALGEKIPVHNINWNYARDFSAAHGQDGGYSIIARSTQEGELIGLKLACTPAELSPQVQLKHENCITPADAQYVSIYNPA